MSLQLIELKSDEEFKPLMETLYDAYTHPYNGFWDMFKGESEEECLQRFTQWHKGDPTSHWLYVTDKKTGKVLGGTQWNIYEKNPFEKPGPKFAAYWIKEGTEFRKIADRAFEKFLAPRPTRMNRPHLLIMWCGTHSQERRRGAGMMMMEWGTKKADEMGLDAFVEATDDGYPLYKAAGFVTVNEFVLDVEDKQEGEEYQRLRNDLKLPMHGYFMWRPAGGKFEEGVTKFPWET